MRIRTAYNREYYKKNAARLKEDAKRWRETHSSHVSETKKSYYAANRAKIRAYQRDHHLRRAYGISLEDRDQMLAAQHGCAICHTANAHWHVDHDHASGKVRGILCSECNTAIGKLGDSAELLRAAASYLEKEWS